MTVTIAEEDICFIDDDHCIECSHAPVDHDENATNRRALLDWHDKAHGLTSWQTCTYEPCSLLTLDYRETP